MSDDLALQPHGVCDGGQQYEQDQRDLDQRDDDEESYAQFSDQLLVVSGC
jgi:hypothetical protein